IVLVLATGAGVYALQSAPQKKAAARTAPPVPVSTAPVMRQDVPIFLDALGTVQAVNSIAVRTQVDGPLQSVNFVEGQEVRKGDTLAVIDPRPYQAALDQGGAKKGEDQGQLVGARKELERSKQRGTRRDATPQTVDQEQGKL